MKIIPYFKIITFALAIIVLQSCEEGDLPNPDNTQNDRLKWSYNFETVMAFSLFNTVPAIDETGNIYVSADVQYGSQIIKLASDGTEIWSQLMNESPLSRLIYYDNKIYYNSDSKLICISAVDGTQLWAATAVNIYNTIALTADKIYTTNYEDGGIFGNNNSLLAFDHSGNKIWETKIKYSENDTIIYPNAISVVGNNIYLGTFVEVDNSEFAIINYVDEGNSVSKNWTWLAPEDYSVGGGSPWIRDFAIDENNNIIFGMENSGAQNIFSINSSSGTENWRTSSLAPKIISSVSVDANGNCYSAYRNIEKLNVGGIVWESEYKDDWQYEGLVSKAPVISMNGNLTYENMSLITTSISPNGASLWEQYYGCNLCNDEFHNIAINRNGDIIIIGKGSLYCFEGDGTGLADKGWPKKYGNYGNTSSK